MTAAEEGVLLLCCQLGDPGCKPLTMARFRELGLRVRASNMSESPFSELTEKFLCQLNYSSQDAAHIVSLLCREKQLHNYLSQAEKNDIHTITRISAGSQFTCRRFPSGSHFAASCSSNVSSPSSIWQKKQSIDKWNSG